MAVIFSDLHLRESSEDVCFKILDAIERLAVEHGRHVVFCGDFWHIRYQVSVRLLNRVKDVLGRWESNGITIDLLPGNHDQIDVAGGNALEVFEYDGDPESGTQLRVWTEPGWDPTRKLGFVPYRKDPEAQLEALRSVAAKGPRVIFGHFAVKGSIMNNGRRDQDGIELAMRGAPAQRPLLVLGHYHKHQHGESYLYVGSPYQTSYGEAGNVCGCLLLDKGKLQFHSIDVGAPEHHIIEWDPVKQSEPPARPGKKGDHVRLDIKASQEMLVSGKFKGVLKQHGLDEAQINVIPTKVDRQHKFELGKGETLLQAAERFVDERFSTPDPASMDKAEEEARDAMIALRRWAE
jgi:DNA repair exonuclease SbcCD nuclease subunit